MVTLVSKHAIKRMKERLGLPKKACQKASDIAFEKGVKHSNTKGRIHKFFTYLYHRNKTANNLRVYGKYVYVFAGNTLITVVPLPSTMRHL